MGVIARQSIKGSLANYLGVALGFFTTFFVMTRVLSTDEVGLTQVMVNAAVLFASFAQLGTSASLTRFFPQLKEHRSTAFGMSMLLPLAGFALLCVVLMLLKEPIVAAYSQRAPLLEEYFHLVPMLTLFVMYLTIFETGAAVLLRITVPKMVHEVGIRLINLAAYLLYGYGVVNLDGFVTIICLSWGIAMLMDLFYLMHVAGERSFRKMFRIEKGVVTKAMVKEMLFYSLFMAVTAIAANIQMMSTLFLGAKTGLAMTGVYTIANYIANVVDVPSRSLGAISKPVVATAVNDGRWNEVNRLIKQVSLHQLLFATAIFYIIWINLPLLYKLIPNGADYAGGTIVVLLLGVAKITNSTLAICTDTLSLSRYYTRLLPLMLLLTAGAIIFNACLIGPFGIAGAGSATLLSYLIYFILLLSYIQWRLKVNPFSAAQLKVLVVAAIGLALNEVWSHFVTPWIAASDSTGMLLLDATLKTLLLVGAAGAAVVAWRVSESVNDLVLHFSLKKLRN